MVAKIRKGDLVGVVRGRSSDEGGLAERNAHRAAKGLGLLRPGDKGKQGRIVKVFPAEGTVLVEGVNFKTHHACQGRNQAGGIETVEALISLAKVVLVDPDTKQRVYAGFREGVAERDGHTHKARARVTRDDVVRGIEQGKEV